jgi:hypothetical protein
LSGSPIGRYAAQFIGDGSTIQAGLGNNPEVAFIVHEGTRHLGIGHNPQKPGLPGHVCGRRRERRMIWAV